jgi:hypothetical protein
LAGACFNLSAVRQYLDHQFFVLHGTSFVLTPAEYSQATFIYDKSHFFM